MAEVKNTGKNKKEKLTEEPKPKKVKKEKVVPEKAVEKEVVKSVKREEAKVRAIGKYVRISPRKARQVIDLIRRKKVDDALTTLKFLPKAGAKIISKVISSALANAEHNQNLKKEMLYVSEAYVDQGPTLKRYRPRAMGRASRIHKRTSHITVVIEEAKKK